MTICLCMNVCSNMSMFSYACLSSTFGLTDLLLLRTNVEKVMAISSCGIFVWPCNADMKYLVCVPMFLAISNQREHQITDTVSYMLYMLTCYIYRSLKQSKV